jgi:hypothetical protein
MEIQSLVFDSPQGPGGLKITAKRYKPAGSRVKQNGKASCGGDGRALTLLFAHCVGSRECDIYPIASFPHKCFLEIVDKEQWEPTIEHLFNLQRELPDQEMKGNSIIREAWSVDWQNHGDGAVVNRKILQAPGRAPGVCMWSFMYFTIAFSTWLTHTDVI